MFMRVGLGSALMRSGRTEAEVLLDVMAGACQFFLLNGKRFIALIQTEHPDIQIGSLVEGRQYGIGVNG
jgi:hypothetical protein